MIHVISRRRLLAVGSVSGVAAIVGGCGAVSTRAGLYVGNQQSAPRWIDDTNGAPAWSPSGEHLAWGDDHGLRIWRQTEDDISRFDVGPVVGKPAWSPDSASIVFLNSASRELQRLDINSGDVLALSSVFEGPDGAIRPPIVTRGGPAWSPDGASIAFVCWDGYGDELCIVGSDGGLRQQLTSLGVSDERAGGSARSSVTGMAWSPDSAALAVSVQAEQQGAAAGVYRIEVSERSGERLSKLTTNSPLTWDGATDSLIFSARVEGRSDVYRLPAVGGSPEALTTALAEGARDPAIDTIGNLAVISGSMIAILRPGSDNVTSLEEPGLASAAPALSATGERLAFLALPRPIERYP